VVAFVFKVVFGLIGKNEKKSEDEDRRLEGEIKELRREMRDTDERHRQHENDLFNRSGAVRAEVAYMKGQHDAEKDCNG